VSPKTGHIQWADIILENESKKTVHIKHIVSKDTDSCVYVRGSGMQGARNRRWEEVGVSQVKVIEGKERKSAKERTRN